MKRLLCLALILVLGFAWAGMGEELSQEALRELLYEMSLQGGDGSEFVVLPDQYREPAIGMDGRYSLLILGVDSDNPEITGRSDTMILAVLDARAQTLKLISFMRDLYVTIPGRGHNRLNASYAFGGEKLLRRTLENSFGVQADSFVAVNYSLMADLVDAIGGVELMVEEFELRPLNGILKYYNYQRGIPQEEGVLAASGLRVLTGLQTLSYARIRKPDSDFERVQRQQRVLRAIYAKIRQKDVGSLTDILIRFVDRIRTDISLSEAIALAQDVVELDELEIRTLSVPIPSSFSARMINGASFLVPNLSKNREAISAFLMQP